MTYKDIDIRDPLYGFIEFPSSISSILSIPPLIRLTRIKQLGHTYLIYPSAAHTRFEHSIGTYHVAGLMANRLDLDKEERENVQLAALLHDVGHGPFSHPFEEAMRIILKNENFSHEHVTQSIIEKDNSLKKVLDSEKINRIMEIYRNHSLSSEIVSGSLDADKLDYLRRDSYHTGVAYGIFDLERIIRTLVAIGDGNRKYLGNSDKGMHVLESYRIARYLMHTQVYEHKTRLIADDMYIRAIKLAMDEEILNKNLLDPSTESFLREYIMLDDHLILDKIISTGNERSKAKELASNILRRKLFKNAFSVSLNEFEVPNVLKRRRLIKMSREEKTRIEEKISNELNIPPEDIILHIQSSEIKLYERMGEENLEEESLLIKKENEIVPLTQISPFSLKQKFTRKLYVFCPEEYKEKVKEVSESIILSK